MKNFQISNCDVELKTFKNKGPTIKCTLIVFYKHFDVKSYL